MRPSRRLLGSAVATLLLAGSVGLTAVGSHASAAVRKGVKPDITLSPSKRSFVQHYDSLLFNDFSPLAHDEVEDVNPPSPDQCRDLPVLDFLCDVYRIRIVKDPTPGASNFTQIIVTWDRQASTPALPLAAVGVGDADLPDIDLSLYADADSPVDYALVGGRGSIIPERIVFEATQEEYDLVVRSGTGLITDYDLKAVVSNELPIKPYEYLDEPPAASSPQAAGTVASPPGRVDQPSSVVPPLALAPLTNDSALAGIGLGTTEQFDPESLGTIGAARPADGLASPSALSLVVALVVTPLLIAAVAAVLMRRRRSAIFA